MITSTIATYLKYANLQMAAESIKWTEGYSGGLRKDYLTFGNDHASKFTDTLATEYSGSDWTILDHKQNTSTGFSATLFRYDGTDNEAKGWKSGECVISFRSTEFIDDAVRDTQVTNKSIKDFGWAFGQLSDMCDWYDIIKSQITGPLSVTGYSLGGHLATAFNMLYQGAASATYTFNGAGVGTVNGALGAVLGQFDSLWHNTAHNDSLFTHANVKALYQTLVAKSTLTHSDYDLVDAWMNDAAAKQDASLLLRAVGRVLDAQAEYDRVGAFATNPPRSEVAGLGLDYWLASYKAAESTASTNTMAPYTSESGGYLPGMTDLLGLETANALGNPSAVANSQLHYGDRHKIFIESQPLWRGSAVADAVKLTLLYSDIKLLNADYKTSDFGDSHSLALLVDSLAVQAALASSTPR